MSTFPLTDRILGHLEQCAEFFLRKVAYFPKL